MTTRGRFIVLLAFLILASPGRLCAQEGGIGAIMDFIQRLSGPTFIGGGLTVKWPLGWQNLSLRVNGVHRWSIAEEGEVAEGDDVEITMLSAQPMLEVDLPGTRAAVAVGAGIHRFGGDVDSFTHWSAILQGRLRLLEFGPLAVHAGPGLHLFPPFADDDFQPLDVSVARDGWEAVFTAFLSVEFRF